MNMEKKSNYFILGDWEEDFMVYPLDYKLFFRTQNITEIQKYLKNIVGKKCKIMFDFGDRCAYINDTSKQYEIISYKKGLGILVYTDKNYKQDVVAIESMRRLNDAKAKRTGVE
jgi:hypothetical protein